MDTISYTNIPNYKIGTPLRGWEGGRGSEWQHKDDEEVLPPFDQDRIIKTPTPFLAHPHQSVQMMAEKTDI